MDQHPLLNITSSTVKSPIESLGLSNGARSGLTGFIAGLARQDNIASRNVTINNLQPGFDTDRLRGNLVAAAEVRLCDTLPLRHTSQVRK